ncbi:MAG: hypothetical protein ACTSO2_20280, partial [Promethearchaeota archaeon]
MKIKINGITKVISLIFLIVATLFASGRVIGDLMRNVANNKETIKENKNKIQRLQDLVFENSKQIAVLYKSHEEYKERQ